MSGLRGRWVQRPWGRLRVYAGGGGPVLLAVHGLGGSGRYWEGLARLVGSRYTVVAPDLGGFGASDKPDVSYDRSFHLDNLDAALAAVGADGPLVLVGHSMGGILAALWAAHNPGDTARLALVSTPFPEGQKRADRVQRQGAREREARGAGPLLYRTIQRAWPVITLPYRSRVFPRAVVADYMRHTLRSYWASASALLWDGSIVDELAPLREAAGQRQLLLYARDDRRVPAGDQARWRELLPRAELQLVDHGGHQLLLRGGVASLARWLTT